MISAALEELERLKKQSGPENPDGYELLTRYYQRRLAAVDRRFSKDGQPSEEQLQRQDSLAQQLRTVERSVVLNLRDENKIHDEVLRTLERELDLLDARFADSEV